MHNFLLRLRQFSESIPTVLAVGTFVIAATLICRVHPTLAASGDALFNVKDEVGNNLAGVSVQIACLGGGLTDIGTTNGSGNISLTAAQLLTGEGGGEFSSAGCDDTDSIDVYVSKDGYVHKSYSSTYLTGSDNTYNVTGVQFGLKVIVRDELNHSVTDADTVTSNYSTADDAGVTTPGTYYFAKTGVQDLFIAKTGFINADSTNNIEITLDPNSQTILNYGNFPTTGSPISGGGIHNLKGLEYSVKLHVLREAINDGLQGADVSAGIASTACINGTDGYYYCQIPVGDDDGVLVHKVGYVTDTTGSTGHITVTSQSVPSDILVRAPLRVYVEDQIGTSTSADLVTFDGHTASGSDGYVAGSGYYDVEEQTKGVLNGFFSRKKKSKKKG